ncbi:MAG: hypothetical protein QOG23_5239 [Blastocatellia bacterium]|nr:hypothetical protein [Blastocatellia bacterium]
MVVCNVSRGAHYVFPNCVPRALPIPREHLLQHCYRNHTRSPSDADARCHESVTTRRELPGPKQTHRDATPLVKGFCERAGTG